MWEYMKMPADDQRKTNDLRKDTTPGGSCALAAGSAREKESAARAAIEASAGRTFSDPEWGRVRARLLNFVSIVRAWQQEATTSKFGLRQAA
jgi:hypothetical protein